MSKACGSSFSRPNPTTTCSTGEEHSVREFAEKAFSCIGRAIEWLRDQKTIAILLVEQYFDFVHGLADTFAVMDRGEIVLSGTRAEMDPEKVHRHLTV